jgi:hypothetical protein
MSLFKKLFGHNKSSRTTGVYKVENKKLIELDETPGNGSINSIIEYLGFETNQVHLVMFFDSKIVTNIGFKIFTKTPLFIMTKDHVSNLTLPQINKELKNIDWNFEYSSTEIESILETGIDCENLTLDYLQSVTTLKKKTSEIYLAPELDLILYFHNNLLVKTTSIDGLSSASKWLKDLNPAMFEDMLEEAKSYHNSELEAKDEVNKQCDALQSIPNANNNEYTNEHISKHGNCNFYNLHAAHYSPSINMNEFLHVNKGRYIKLSDNEIKIGSYVYQFDENGLLNHTEFH